jgi:hypothetical protein
MSVYYEFDHRAEVPWHAAYASVEEAMLQAAHDALTEPRGNPRIVDEDGNKLRGAADIKKAAKRLRDFREAEDEQRRTAATRELGVVEQ